MSSHKPDIHHLDLKQYKYYQSVLNPFNVEHNPISANQIGRIEGLLDKTLMTKVNILWQPAKDCCHKLLFYR